MPEELVCGVCGDPLSGKLLIECPKCGVPHHKDCWDYNGEKCTAYGCNPSSKKDNLPVVDEPSLGELISEFGKDCVSLVKGIPFLIQTVFKNVYTFILFALLVFILIHILPMFYFFKSRQKAQVTSEKRIFSLTENIAVLSGGVMFFALGGFMITHFLWLYLVCIFAINILSAFLLRLEEIKVRLIEQRKVAGKE